MFRRLSKGYITTGLIQEPWAYEGRIKGLNVPSYQLVYNDKYERPRAALVFRNDTNYAPIPEFITRDLVAAVAEVPTDKGKRLVVFASAYLPGEDISPPPEDVKRLIDWCQTHGKHLILGCDANAHHTVWGSTDINDRGKRLLDYACSTDSTQLDILNRGSKPTFINAIRREVLDVTFASAFISHAVSDWRVLDTSSMSDHQYVAFDVEASKIKTMWCRVPKSTDWILYNELLKQELQGLKYNIATAEELDAAALHLGSTLMEAYKESCPLKTVIFSRNVPWWNRELNRLRTATRRLFNRAKRNGDWTAYRTALT